MIFSLILCYFVISVWKSRCVRCISGTFKSVRILKLFSMLKGNPAKFHREFRYYFFMGLGGRLLLAIAISASIPFIFYMYKIQYSLSLYYAALIFTVDFFVAYFLTVLRFFCMSSDNTISIAATSLARSVTVSMLSVMLIAYWGVEGAALSSLIATIGSALILYASYAKSSRPKLIFSLRSAQAIIENDSTIDSN